MQLDLNQPEFQQELFDLTKDQQRSVLNTLRKLSSMAWNQVYQDRGLKWELVKSRRGPEGETVYTFRCGRAFRAVAYRIGDRLRLLSLHPDHDSAYE